MRSQSGFKPAYNSKINNKTEKKLKLKIIIISKENGTVLPQRTEATQKRTKRNGTERTNTYDAANEVHDAMETLKRNG